MVYTTSLESFDELVSLVRRLARFCGADVLSKDYRPTFLTLLTCVGCSSYIFTGAYSAWYFYPDIFKSLQALAPVGISVQGLVKLYNAIVHTKFFQEREKFLRNFHTSNTGHRKNNEVLLRLMVKTNLAAKLLLVGYVVAIAGFGLYPLYYYILYGDRIFALEVVLPGVAETTSWGYAATLGYQLFLLAIAINGISAADTAILMFVSNLAGLVDVYKNKLKELDELLEAGTTEKAEIREKMKEIVEAHFTIVSYESHLDKRYITTNFVQVASSVSCLTLSMFLCYMTNYLPGYAFIFGALFQLLEFCLLGTIFSVKNDQIIVAIYDTKWYLLDKAELKALELMLHNSQHPVNLTVGGFAPLNIETFVEIMKNIYQYFAMLISFMEP